MSAEENMALVRRLFVAIEAKDAALLGELLDPGYRLHFNGLPAMDRDQAIGAFLASMATFPDIRHEIEDQFAAGDRVATRLTARGTHRGDFRGLPPTGKAVAIGAIYIHRAAGGRVVEQWVRSDALGLLQQLGAIPAPGA